MDRTPLLELMRVGEGRGLEIGALDKPMAPPTCSSVEYVDRASREALQAYYQGPGHGVDVAAIVEVSHIQTGPGLLDSVGGERAFDYVAASHVIEHVPDLFGWLREIASVLKDGGVAGFAVPDKRFTFDSPRRATGGAEVIDAYVRKLDRPDARQLFDNFNYFSHPQTGADRDGNIPSEEVDTRRARELLALCQWRQTSTDYIDAHCWTFTPCSIVELLDLGNRLDLLPFEIAMLTPTPTGDAEFLLALRRLPEGLSEAERRARFLASRARLDLPDEEPEQAISPSPLEHWALERVAAMEASASWRLMAPLRAVSGFVRRLAGH
jgi:hypothetical protein